MADARPRSPVRPPPNVGFDEVQGDLYVDEELTPWYSPETWYPVRLGAVYNDRYQALVKLGYGSASTTWLCRDLEGHCYVTLKVYEQNSAQAATEKAAHEHLKQIRSKHPGQKFIRKLKDSFEVHWREGSNVCLVFDALAISVKARREMFVGDRFPWGGVRFILYAVLQALDFLHTRARLVHTDLSDSNIVISTKDEAYFDALVEDVRNGPGPRKRHGDRDIYPHRLVDMPEHPGEPIICDFGEAEWGKPSYSRVAMPNIDRAPEMVLHIDWKEKIDIWALGCMVSVSRGFPYAEDTNVGRT